MKFKTSGIVILIVLVLGGVFAGKVFWWDKNHPQAAVQDKAAIPTATPIHIDDASGQKSDDDYDEDSARNAKHAAPHTQPPATAAAPHASAPATAAASQPAAATQNGTPNTSDNNTDATVNPDLQGPHGETVYVGPKGGNYYIDANGIKKYLRKHKSQ